MEKDIFNLKLATYGSDPERYAEAVFPEWYAPEDGDLDNLDKYDSVLYDFEDDDEMMTPQKMERLLGQFTPQR